MSAFVRRKSTLKGRVIARKPIISYTTLLWDILHLLYRTGRKGRLRTQTRTSVLSFNPPSFPSERVRFEGKRTDDAQREMEEEKGQRRASKCSKEMGQERRESAILIGKKWEHSIVKPRERMAQSEALHVASTREEREILAGSRLGVFQASFPTSLPRLKSKMYLILCHFTDRRIW